MYLLVCVLLLQHHWQSLQEGPHARRHVQSDHALLLQRCAASGQHVVGCHELFGAVHNQYILGKPCRNETDRKINRYFSETWKNINQE